MRRILVCLLLAGPAVAAPDALKVYRGKPRQVNKEEGRMSSRVPTGRPCASWSGYAAVIWAIGHSRSGHARRILKNHLDHHDPGVAAVAHDHLSKSKRPRTKKKIKKKVRRG